MKICRIKPTAEDCAKCREIEEVTGSTVLCSECAHGKKWYELLNINAGVFGDYAFVARDGKISKVGLDRIYDLQEED